MTRRKYPWLCRICNMNISATTHLYLQCNRTIYSSFLSVTTHACAYTTTHARTHTHTHTHAHTHTHTHTHNYNKKDFERNITYSIWRKYNNNCLLLLLYVGCTTDYRGIPPEYLSSICWFRAWGSSSAFSGVFIVEEVEGVGDKRSRDTTVEVQPLLAAFWKMSLKSPYSPPLVQSKTPGHVVTPLKCQIIKISKLKVVRLMEFCCVSTTYW